ncbi:type II toxin-antitoxin system VapC family toxin [bacterium]|nr:type II toxin-antitoxin system VapC family toxin [bacterium]
MIILDTNVVSEVIKIGRSSAVVTWLDEMPVDSLYLTAVSLSELCIGVEILPSGKRKSALKADLGDLLGKLFGSRVLPFDEPAAIAYGAIVGKARLAGKTVSMPDGQIGSIAAVHGFTVATRDSAPFLALGVSTLNPWDAP